MTTIECNLKETRFAQQKLAVHFLLALVFCTVKKNVLLNLWFRIGSCGCQNFTVKNKLTELQTWDDIRVTVDFTGDMHK